MSLPKVKLNMGKFSIGGILREIGKRVDEIFAPLDTSPESKKEKSVGTPAQTGMRNEWKTEKSTGKKGKEEIAKKRFTDKRRRLDYKKIRRPVTRAGNARGKNRRKMQKNL